MSHAWFAASAASRWMKCGGSTVIDTRHLPREYKPAADRGTALHAVAESCLRGGHDDLPAGLSPPDAEAVMECVRDVRSKPGTKFYEIESQFVPQCGGTSDAVIIHPDGETLEIYDHKFGSWYVSPADNSQLKIYGLGVLRKFSQLYDFKRVILSIGQPACDNFTSWPISVDDLEAWGANVKARVEAIKDGDAEFSPDEETCKWCPGRNICPARASYGRAAARDQFADEPVADELLEDGAALAAIAEECGILDMDPLDWTWTHKMIVAARAKAWAKDIEDHVRQMVLKDPASVPGFKAVEGRRTRQWKDEEQRAEAERFMDENGIGPLWTTPEPAFVTPGGADALIKGKGSGALKKSLKDFQSHVAGAPTVVPESDSRRPIDRKGEAKDQFDEEATE